MEYDNWKDELEDSSPGKQLMAKREKLRTVSLFARLFSRFIPSIVSQLPPPPPPSPHWSSDLYSVVNVVVVVVVVVVFVVGAALLLLLLFRLLLVGVLRQ